MRFGTKTIHAGVEPDPSTGAIMTPIYQTSTYVQESPGKHQGFEYSRTQNPTRVPLEKNIAALENAQYGLCFASGMAAVDALAKLLKPGDEVIVTNDLYGGTYRIFTKIFAHWGLKFHFVDMTDTANVQAAMNENTKMFWVETPTNPMMSVVDIQALATLKEGKDILMVVDNTFATPYLQQPIELGADVVMHSVTKYLAGHSDVIMGAIATNNKDVAERLAFIQNSCGAVPGPMDCFLTLRGIKTLHVRMQHHNENASALAHFLLSQPNIENVYWPGLDRHPNHMVASKQMHGYGGMLSFTLKEDSQEQAFRVLEKFKLFALAESLGGVESLCGHPSTMTHASIPREERYKVGLKDSLIRLSVGIEDIEDLVEDLRQAIN